MDDDFSIKNIALSIIMIVFAVLGITWAIQGNDFFLYKEFAPKYEQVRRETFEQSKAYNDGMVNELDAMRFEYIKATDTQKTALRSVILHRSASYPCEKMPTDLCQFITQLRNERSIYLGD